MTGDAREMRDLVTDASGLINLFATGREAELLRGAARRLLITEVTAAEATYILGPPDEEGNDTKLRIDLTELRAAGLVNVQPLTSEMNALFVKAAAELTDRDAAPVAVAAAMGLALWSDDAKQRRVALALHSGLELVSTLAFVRSAVTRLKLPASEITSIVRGIRIRGRFLPPRRDPDAAWFMAALNSDETPTEADGASAPGEDG